MPNVNFQHSSKFRITRARHTIVAYKHTLRRKSKKKYSQRSNNKVFNYFKTCLRQ